MSKKIAYLGPAHPYRGGIAGFGERMMKAFQDEGHSVKLYTFTLQYPSILFPGKTQFTDATPPADLEIVRGLNSVNPLSWFLLGKQIKEEKPDMLIIAYWLPFMGPAFTTVARLAKANGHTRVLGLIHNMVPHESRLGDAFLTRRFAHQVDGFLSMSKQVDTDIQLFDSTKPRVITPHPLYDNFGEQVSKSVAIEHLGLDPTCRYILFFGFVRDYKGLDLLIEAFGDAYFKENSIKLLIAGEYYSSAQPYEDQIARLELHDHVIQHAKFISDEEVKYYFCAADIVAQPYKHATQSGVTQIAYHFEVPMLVTDVGGLAELVPHDRVGYVVDPDPRAICIGLKDFFTQNRESAMRQEVAIEKQRFTWDKLVDRFMNLYNDV